MPEHRRVRVLLADGRTIEVEERELSSLSATASRSTTQPFVERPAGDLFGSNAMAQALLRTGMPETLAGLGARAAAAPLAALGPVGAAAAALAPVAAAGLTRYARGRLTGEPAKEAAVSAGISAFPEVGLPGAGRALRAAGTRLVSSVLPVAEQEAREAGRGSLALGKRLLARLAVRQPGVTASGTYRATARQIQAAEDALGQAIQAAEAAGARVPAEPVLERGRSLLRPGGVIRERLASPAEESGARGVLRRLEQQVTREEPVPTEALREQVLALQRAGAPLAAMQQLPTTRTVIEDLEPSRVRAILRHTEFVPGGLRESGANIMKRALRTELSEQLKRTVPGAVRPLEQQARLLPLLDALDRLLDPTRGTSLTPELLATMRGGGLSGRPFMVARPLPAARFTLGKLIARGGEALGSPLMPGLARATAGLFGGI